MIAPDVERYRVALRDLVAWVDRGLEIGRLNALDDDALNRARALLETETVVLFCSRCSHPRPDGQLEALARAPRGVRLVCSDRKACAQRRKERR